MSESLATSSPMELGYAPPEYDAPDLDGDGWACLLQITDPDPIGVLVWTGDDDLALLPAAPPGSTAHYVFLDLRRELSALAGAGVRAHEARNRVRLMVPHRAVEERHLPDVVGEARARAVLP